MLSWLILAAGVAQAADCQPTSSEQLTSVMQQALIDFATLDEESFFASTKQAEQALPCLDELFLPPNAAAYHRLMALRSFFDGDEEATELSFRAALSIEPDYQISAKLAPEGGKLHRIWTSAKSGPNPFLGSFTAPSGKYSYVDGVETRTYAEDLPNIVQYGPGDGSIDWTGYVPANQKPPPSIPTAGATVADAGADDDDDPYAGMDDSDGGRSSSSSSRMGESSRDKERSSSKRERQDLVDAPKPEKQAGEKGKGGLIAATAISAVAAGGLYGGAVYYRNEFERYPTRKSYLLTNGAFFGSIGAGVLTVTFGSLAIFTADGVQFQPGLQF